MSFYQLQRTQKIPAPIETVWEFISSPKNLKTITPPSMGFDIISSGDIESMYAGMIIAYKVKPVFNIPVTWVTEITHVQNLKYFVDEQRIGPYRLWHHQHKITAIDGGTLMEDIVTYQLPFGIIGSIVHALLVRKKLESIFNYRFTAVEKLFGKF